MQTIKFNLTNNYKLVPEGERTLTITSCEASPSGNPTDVKIIYTDSEGGTINEKISLDRALWKISRICQCVLNIEDGQEMSIKEMCDKLKGKSIKCEVVHAQGTRAREDGTFPTFANVRNIISGVDLATENDLPNTMTATPSSNPRSSILAGL